MISKSLEINIEELIRDKKRPENTVHYGKTKRFEMAKQQLDVPTIDKKYIIKLTNSFIKAYGLKVYDGENIVKTDNINLTEFNENTMETYNGITSEKDIIWMKFTSDNRVGVVACSNDINFDIPSTKDEYDEIISTRSGGKKCWKYNTSGILVHSVDLEWDESFFLVFPLLGLEKGKEGKKQRHDIETGIGNYLILNDVPIIDYYSHRI